MPTEHTTLVASTPPNNGKRARAQYGGSHLRLVLGAAFVVFCVGAFHVHERHTNRTSNVVAKAVADDFEEMEVDGGEVDLEITSEQVQGAAKYILAEINCMKCSCSTGCTDESVLSTFTVLKAQGEVAAGEVMRLKLKIDHLNVDAVVWEHEDGKEEISSCPVAKGVYEFEGQYSNMELETLTIEGKPYQTSHQEQFCALHGKKGDSKRLLAVTDTDLHSFSTDHADFQRLHAETKVAAGIGAPRSSWTKTLDDAKKFMTGLVYTDEDLVMIEAMSKTQLTKDQCEKFYPALKTHTAAQLKATLPKSFDSRKTFKYCNARIAQHQGGCGSCWAFAAATTLSWRMCAMSKGVYNTNLSPQTFTSCTYPAANGAPVDKGGCGGGNPMAAYSQIVNDIWDPRTADDDAYTATDATGRGGMGGGTPIPNGPETCAADQGASKDLHCLPQQFLDRSKGRMILCKVGTACWGAGYFCQMKDTKCDSGLRMCKRKSTLTKGKKEGGMKFKFKNLRMPYVTKSSCFGDWTGSQIRQYEIMTGGAVSASMQVQPGFNGKAGTPVTKCEKGSKKTGGHAVVLVGWGEDAGTPYWILQNSWGKSWQDQGFSKHFFEPNELTPATEREDCSINTGRAIRNTPAGPRNTLMDPDLAAMTPPELVCSNGGKFNKAGDGCVCPFPMMGAGVKRSKGVKMRMGCTGCMLTERKKKGQPMCANGGVPDEQDCSCACVSGFGGGLCTDTISLKLVKAQVETKCEEDAAKCDATMAKHGGIKQAVKHCHRDYWFGKLMRKDCPAKCCQCGACATCAADSPFDIAAGWDRTKCARLAGYCKSTTQPSIALAVSGNCKKTCGNCGSPEQKLRVGKLAVFEVTITRTATAFSSFQPKGGDYIGMTTKAAGKTARRMLTAPGGAAGKVVWARSVDGKRVCGEKAKYKEQATMEACAKSLQYEVHAGNGVWNKAKLPGCKGEDTTQCRYTIKATFTADVGTDKDAKLFARYISYNGINEFKQDAGFSSKFGGSKFFGAWYKNPPATKATVKAATKAPVPAATKAPVKGLKQDKGTSLTDGHFQGVQLSFSGKLTKSQAYRMAKDVEGDTGAAISSSDIMLEEMTNVVLSLPDTISLADAMAAFRALVHPGVVTSFEPDTSDSTRRRLATGKAYAGVVKASEADIAKVETAVSPATMQAGLSTKLNVPAGDIKQQPNKVSTKVSVKTANKAFIAQSKKEEVVKKAIVATGAKDVQLTAVNGVKTGGAARASLTAGLAMLCLSVVWGALA